MATALFRNREALIPLIARWGMPGSEWLLPDEENFPQIGESDMVPGAFGRLQASNVPENAIVEDDFLATRAIQAPSSAQRISVQEVQELEKLLGGRSAKDPNMLKLIRDVKSRRSRAAMKNTWTDR